MSDLSALEMKLNCNSPEFSRMKFRTVNLHGEIVGYEDNVASFHLENLPVFDLDKFSQVQEKYQGQIFLKPNLQGFELELFGTENTFDNSWLKITEILRDLGEFIPFLSEETSELSEKINHETAFRLDSTLLVPENMILVRTYKDEDQVYNLEGWIDNSIMRFNQVHFTKLDCLKYKKTYSMPNIEKKKNLENETIVEKFSDEYLDMYLDGRIINEASLSKLERREEVEQKFDPFELGFPSFIKEALINEALLLSDRAKAKHEKAFRQSKNVASIELMCSAFEDYERSLIIYTELKKAEDFTSLDANIPTNDYKTALFVREYSAKSLFEQIKITKDLMKHFPSYSLAKRKIKDLVSDIDGLFVESTALIERRENFVDFIMNSIWDDKVPEDEKERYEEKYNIFDDDRDTQEQEIMPTVSESESPIQKYILDARNELRDFELVVNYFQNSPYEFVEPIYTKGTVDEINNLNDRRIAYMGILSYCKSEIEGLEKAMTMMSKNTPAIKTAQRQISLYQKEIDEFQPKYEELVNIMDYCAARDPLCFEQPMPIKILDDARKFANEIMKKEEKINLINVLKDFIELKSYQNL